MPCRPHHHRLKLTLLFPSIGFLKQDANAIRVDNLQGEKVGHIKRQTAAQLAEIMDHMSDLVQVEASIPYQGNAFTLPVLLDFFAPIDQATEMAQRVKKRIKNFRPSPEFFDRKTLPIETADARSAPVVVQRTKINWEKQQEELDKMFDEQLERQLQNLPPLPAPSCLQFITLFDFQIQGIRWLVQNETHPRPAPFFTTVQEKGQTMHLCEITQSSQKDPPTPMRGSILCDAMGLGKSIQTIGLILLAPPAGVKYVDNDSHAVLPECPVPSPSTANKCTLIVCPVSVMANWTQQVQEHVQEGVLQLRLYHGKDRHQVLDQVLEGQVDILLVSYHTLAADFGINFLTPQKKAVRKKSKRQTIFDICFHRIVLDEAHTIRNSNKTFFKSVSKIQADRKLALTGTPFINRAEDVFSLLSFVGMEPLNDHQIFKRAISHPIQNGQEIGLARLRTAMGFVSLRRSKHTIPGLQMVEKHVQLASVEFAENSMHKEVYDALFGTVRVALQAILQDETNALSNYTNIFEKLLRLRQACCSGLLLTQERRDIALKLWKQICSGKQHQNLSAEEALKLLEKLKGQFTQELPECGICMEEFDESVGTILKSCSHVFCKSCIEQVLSRSNQKCPYCRCDFRSEDIVDLSTAESAASSTLQEDKPTAEFDTPPKITALLETIKSSMKPDEKGVIFSQFTSYLDVIGEAMQGAGHTYVRIDGSVPAKKRIEIIQQFNADDGPRFILCSLLASGTGINLTRGNHVFLLDTWWNEAQESQARARVHRLSQTREVKVTKFIMKGTIEERMVVLQQTKSLQAKGALQKLTGNEKRKALLGALRGLLDIQSQEA